MKKEIAEIDRQIEELERKISDKNIAKETAHTLTRVSGYYRPVSNFHAGKQQEYRERLEYELH
jgi:anaerobic ribonucleoside-triphosphate reductase